MTEADRKELLSQIVVGSGPQWTFLGTSQEEAMAAVSAARQASGALTAWSSSCMVRATQACMVESHLIDHGAVTPRKKARQINGVSKAVSPEYSTLFGELAADFISVDAGLAALKDR